MCRSRNNFLHYKLAISHASFISKSLKFEAFSCTSKMETSNSEDNFELVYLPQERNNEELINELGSQSNTNKTRDCLIKVNILCFVIFLVYAFWSALTAFFF